jgi:ABC-2 type transport system ATP-binding protein
VTALEIRDLCKRYGRTQVLFDLSLDVERGQVYGLLGPNGSGKTTTLNCALGLLRADSGSARILGEPARSVHRTHGRVGVVFDRSVLIPTLSVRQNLEYVRRLQGHVGGRSIDEALELAGIRALADRRAGKLSLGQAKRLAIAGALLGSPELLILDEPLSGLDTLGVRSMLTLFRSLAEHGTTLVLSSHQLHEMQRVVTHAGIVLNGRVVRQGSLAELLETERARYELLVQPLDVALEVAGALRGIAVLESRESGPPEPARGRIRIAGLLRVQLDGTAPSTLVRKLVEGGCDVESCVPSRLDLQTVFERLVEERGAREVA